MCVMCDCCQKMQRVPAGGDSDFQKTKHLSCSSACKNRTTLAALHFDGSSAVLVVKHPTFQPFVKITPLLHPSMPGFSNRGRYPPGGRERFARGTRACSDILLKITIMANKLLFPCLCLILRLREERVSMTNAKRVATEKV